MRLNAEFECTEIVFHHFMILGKNSVLNGFFSMTPISVSEKQFVALFALEMVIFKLQYKRYNPNSFDDL